MRPVCHTPALGTPLCAPGAFCGVVRPACAQVRGRYPVPARVTPRRLCAGVWSMDLALRIFKHHIGIAGQNVLMAVCGPCWFVKHGPEKNKWYQCVQCCFSLLVCVRIKSLARMRARMCVCAYTRECAFFFFGFQTTDQLQKNTKGVDAESFQDVFYCGPFTDHTDQGEA